MKVDPESVYFEPTQVWTLDRATGDMQAPMGLYVHAKLGARWRAVLLMPDEGESFGDLCARVGQWYADEPVTFASELIEGSDRARSSDSERQRA